MKNRIEHQFLGFLKTPPLWIDGELFELNQFPLPNPIIPEDRNLQSLLPALATNFVLGKRIENFFELIINLSSPYKIITANLQIHKEKITIGEIDFLLKDLQRNIILHIEVVYKFYIYDPSLKNEMERWIGPNRKDSLLQKISKLKQGQLPLIYKPETVEVLKSLYVDINRVEQLVCFKASLFVPYSLKDREFKYINNKCISGYWIHFSEFEPEKYSDCEFFTPRKLDWPVDPEFQEEWFTFEEIRMIIKELLRKKKSPLIWMKNSEDQYSRFFVVWW